MAAAQISGERLTSDPVGVGDVVADKYEVEGFLGRGGVGVVVAAHHTTLGVRVALKMLRAEIAHDPDVAARFQREARAAAKLRSAHVARVMDAGSTEDGRSFLAMELLEGRDFGAILKEGALPIADAVDYVLQACDAVAEAHALGIVHRDLKAANLFLTKGADGAPLVKVLDFGLSKVTGRASRSELTSESHVFGSLHYMSPEQMRSSRDADERSDIWSLGVILYAFVAGRVPFEGKFLNEVCAAVLTGAAAPLASLRPDVPPALAQVVSRCLQIEPVDRFASVAELARALAPFAPRGAERLARIERLARSDARASSAPRAEPLPTARPAEPTIVDPPRRSRAPALGVALGALALAIVAFVAARPSDAMLTAQPSLAPAVPFAAAFFVVASAGAPAPIVVAPASVEPAASIAPSASARAPRPRPAGGASAPLPRSTKTDEDLIMRLPH